MLRKHFLYDRTLYGELCRTAYASTRDFLRQQAPAGFPRLGRAVPAMVVAPQSFGDLLVPHPHAHAVVSLGLFSSGGVFHRMEEVDFCGLEDLFRERFFEMMLRREKISQETVASMKAWPHSGFQTGWERRIEADDRAGLEGLLSYMDRAPVSLRRLVSLQDGKVSFRYKDYRAGEFERTMTLEATELIRRFLQHVLPTSFHRIRYYGFLANSVRRASLELARRLLGSAPTEPREPDPQPRDSPREPGAAEAEAPLKDSRCPVCKKGRLVIVEKLQPDRTVLKALLPSGWNDTS
ncbi:MAG: transposase [Planctomycetes bacterium]|nr:transposase [Planctomycetota bacterium]